MNPLERFEQLASRAADEPIPRIDVTDRVLAEIRPDLPQPERFAETGAMVFAACSALAASVVAVVALNMWSGLFDPLAGLVDPLMMVMQ